MSTNNEPVTSEQDRKPAKKRYRPRYNKRNDPKYKTKIFTLHEDIIEKLALYKGIIGTTYAGVIEWLVSNPGVVADIDDLSAKKIHSEMKMEHTPLSPPTESTDHPV